MTIKLVHIYWILHVISKSGMLYTILTDNWVGLIGFMIAAGVTYVEAMKTIK